MRATTFTSVLCVISLSLLMVVPRQVHGSGEADREQALRLHARAEIGPIGAVESLAGVMVDGRVVHGNHSIWGGELLKAVDSSSAAILLDGVGRITLGKGSAARLACGLESRPEGNGRVLVARLLTGNMAIRLRDEVTAHVESGSAIFNASAGAMFNVGVMDGSPSIEVKRGEVNFVRQGAQRRYVVRPVGLGSSISVRARSTRQIQVQVTDENDRPVPDLPILFALGGKGMGSLGSGLTQRATFTMNTDSRGLASVDFTAGDTPGSDTISATVEGTRFSWIGQITVAKAAGGGWSGGQTALVVAIGAGAAAAIAVALSGEDRQPVRALPPPKVEP